MSLNTTTRTWVTGEIVTAAMLNTEVRDALAGVQAGWSAYTPVVAGYQSVVHSVQAGSYHRVGKTVMFRASWAWSSINTATGGNVTVSLPFAAVAAWPKEATLSQMGTVLFKSNAAATQIGVLELATSTTANLLLQVPGSNLARTTNAIPAGQTVGDRWMVTGWYEAA